MIASLNQSIESMSQHAWAAWLLLGVVAGLLELLVPSFTFSFIALAAVVTAVASHWLLLSAQVILFCLASIGSVILLRPLLLKKFHVPAKMHSRSQQLMHLRGLVTESIDATQGTGRVTVNGEDWLAQAQSQTAIAAGKTIQVVGSDGIVLLVEEI
jgi:membrane protein implicated in regulation of membrane protease activity